MRAKQRAVIAAIVSTLYNQRNAESLRVGVNSIRPQGKDYSFYGTIQPHEIDVRSEDQEQNIIELYELIDKPRQFNLRFISSRGTDYLKLQFAEHARDFSGTDDGGYRFSGSIYSYDQILLEDGEIGSQQFIYRVTW